MNYFIFTLAVVMTIGLVSGKRPWFCQSYDCPDFTARDMGGYEIRNYKESNWVATSIVSRRPDPDRGERSSMFRKLFSYINKGNAKKQKIDMTVPVLTKVETVRRGYKITMMFYLPSSKPPAPKASNVFLVTRPAGNVFVRTFPSYWWPRKSKYRSELSNMKRSIGDSSLYVKNVYYKAGYNSPYDFFKRKQHEVWMDSQ